jgi:hypothetical protein
MPIQYEYTAIPEAQIPRAADPVFQHLLDTYASETNKVVSLWRQFAREDMAFKPVERSSSVLEIMRHQLLSERRFFAEFIGLGREPERRQCFRKISRLKVFGNATRNCARHDWRAWRIVIRNGGWK